MQQARRRLLLVPLLAAVVGGFVATALLRTSESRPPRADDTAALDRPADATVTSDDPARHPATDPQLRMALDGWAERLPATGCALVVDEDRGPLLDVRSGVPVVPASTLKLLTATAALEAAGEAPVDPALLSRLLADSEAAAAEEVAASLGGVPAIAATLARAGIELDGAVIEDASGHSRANRVTCRLLVDLLQRPTTGPVLEPALAVAGRSGTLAERFLGTPLVGVLRGKTGSLSSVSALAGIVRSADATFWFAVVVNAERGERVDDGAALALQQSLGELLVAWPEPAHR